MHGPVQRNFNKILWIICKNGQNYAQNNVILNLRDVDKKEMFQYRTLSNSTDEWCSRKVYTEKKIIIEFLPRSRPLSNLVV